MTQYNLGLIYEYGEGVPEDNAEAAKWYRQAAEQGVEEAQFDLARLYNSGEGVQQSEVRAYAWFHVARAGGDEYAGELMETLQKRMTPEQIAEGDKLAREISIQIEANKKK